MKIHWQKKSVILLLFYILFLVWDFIRIDTNSHSVSDTLINFLPDALVLGILLYIVYIKWSNKK